MKVFIVFLIGIYGALAVVVDDYDPVINEIIELDPDQAVWGLRPLPSPNLNCWYLRFKVKAAETVFVLFSTTDSDDTDYYEVMIGAWGNQNTCVRRKNDEWLLDAKTPGILKDSEFIYLYIKQSHGHWEIGYQYKEAIAGFYDPNLYDVQYVGIRSSGWSRWSFYWPGFGRNIFKTDIHNIGKYKWIFPEIVHENFYMEFAVKAARDAYIVFSPENTYSDDIYEIMLGASDNLFVCIRRKKEEAPIVDVIALDTVHEDEYRYFWVSYWVNEDRTLGIISVGRYGEDEPLATFTDSTPLAIKYFGVTSVECKSWWKFYLLCPDPQYVCEHETFDLHCDYGLVAVDYARYGRDNNNYCLVRGLGPDDVNCGDPDEDLRRIQEKCRGKQDCSIRAKNSFFGDPCVGTFKYLQINYHCCICN